MLGWQIPAELTARFAAQKPAFDGAYKHYLAGRGYLYRFDHEDNIAKALAAFNTAISLDPNYGDAYAGLAEAQLQSFNALKNVELLSPMANTITQLKKIDSKHRLLSYLEAELKLNQGDYKNAVSLFSESISSQPNFIRAYIGLADSYQQLGESAKAEESLLTAYQLMPNNGLVLTELGVFHYSNGSYHSAIDYFELLAQQAPNNFTAYLNISACHYLNGDIKLALSAAQQALAIQSNYIVYSNLGTYYFILRDFNKAVVAFENMIALNDSDYVNWGNLADAYRFANNPKYLDAFRQAIMIAEQTLSFNAHDKTTIASLAYYYANVSNIEKTKFYADQIMEQDTGENIFLVAAAYTRLNNNNEAVKYLEFAINNNYSLAEINTSPLLDNLRSDLQFQQFVIKNLD